MISHPNSKSRIATGDHVNHSFLFQKKNGGRTEDFQKFTLQKQFVLDISLTHEHSFSTFSSV